MKGIINREERGIFKMEEKKKEIYLTDFMDKHIELLINWLHVPHVKKWFSHTEDWIAEVNKRNREYNWIKHYIIYLNEIPIGFCQYYPYWKSGEDWNGTIPKKGTYSVDYMIGEKQFLYQGYGRRTVKLLNQMIRENSDAERIIVQPEKENIASQKTLLSAGYCYDTKNELYIYKIKNRKRDETS